MPSTGLCVRSEMASGVTRAIGFGARFEIVGRGALGVVLCPSSSSVHSQGALGWLMRTEWLSIQNGQTVQCIASGRIPHRMAQRKLPFVPLPVTIYPQPLGSRRVRRHTTTRDVRRGSLKMTGMALSQS